MQGQIHVQCSIPTTTYKDSLASACSSLRQSMANIPWPAWTKKDTTTPEKTGKIANLEAQFNALPPSVAALTIFALGSVTATSSVLFYKRYCRRVRNSQWVTPRLLTSKRWLKGVATSVGDGDNFRFFHTPAFSGYTWPFKFRSIPSLNKDLKDETIHIRLGGVDAPEAAHFGKPAQPYSAESLAWLRQKILGKQVYCQLLRTDQYSRVVAQVHLPPRILPGFLFYGKNLSAEMLRAGWAVTYEQSGAEYGHLSKEKFLSLEAEAKAARRGMWKEGANAETPAQYKRRHALAAAVDESTKTPKQPAKTGWLKSIFSSSETRR